MISAPYPRTASILVFGASVGMTTALETPAIRAAQATAWAWLPAETVTSPRALSSALKERTLLRAPRGLNEPVFWKLSHFRCRRTPRRRPSCDDDTIGVRCTFPASREAARRISSRPIIPEELIASGGAEEEAAGSALARTRHFAEDRDPRAGCAGRTGSPASRSAGRRSRLSPVRR